MSEFVATTTWSRSRRHWSPAAGMRPGVEGVSRDGGSSGATLCHHTAYGTDQEATDAEAKRYGFPAWQGLVVADLPPCKTCEQLRARMEAALAEFPTPSA